MKKTQYLFIVRHGHAQFNGPTDFTRELKPKGIKAAKRTAQFIKHQCLAHQISIDLCISSSATRTKQTAQIIIQMNAIEETQYHKELYSTSVSSWLDKIEQSSAKTIVLVGHNPTFSQMVSYFYGKQIYMKPANCAFVELEIKEDGIVYPAKLINYLT